MSQTEATEGTRRSTRNPRRRLRPESDSLPSQPRRKRSKISNETFSVPDDAASAAGASVKQNGSAVVNGHGRGHGTRSVRKASVQPDREGTSELVVRGAKKTTTTKRVAKSDGSTVLVCGSS